MPFEKVEFEFPNEKEENTEIEVEASSAEEVDVGGKKAKANAEKDVAVVDDKVDSINDDVEIEVVDDTPKADRGRKPSEPPEEVTDEELEDYSEKVRKRIQHFSKGYHDERRAKESAIRERKELERVTQQLLEENKKLKGNVNKNQTALLEQAKKAATTEWESAQKAYKEAYESGESDAVLKAQDELTNTKLRLDKLNNFKIPTLQEDETPVKQEEMVARAPVVDEQAREWQKQNTWFNEDPEMTAFALGLHDKLIKEGVNPQDKEYYEKIDSRMRQVFPENFEEAFQQSDEDRQQKRQSNVVAPATRSTAPKKIRLTQSQVAIAKRLGLTPEQYAKQVAIDMRK
jgi:hypothetical protein